LNNKAFLNIYFLKNIKTPKNKYIIQIYSKLPTTLFLYKNISNFVFHVKTPQLVQFLYKTTPMENFYFGSE